MKPISRVKDRCRTRDSIFERDRCSKGHIGHAFQEVPFRFKPIEMPESLKLNT